MRTDKEFEQLHNSYDDLKEKHVRLKVLYEDAVKQLNKTKCEVDLLKKEIADFDSGYIAILESILTENGLMQKHRKRIKKEYVNKKVYDNIKQQCDGYIRLYNEYKEKYYSLITTTKQFIK